MEYSIEEKKNRIKNVFEYLAVKNVTQKELADVLDCDESAISRLKRNPPQYISDDWLETLRKKYKINPEYIKLESNSMLDVLGKKLEHFIQFVDSWDVVRKKENGYSPTEYLHFTMDENFYNFLLESFHLELLSETGFLGEEAEKTLKNLHDASPIPKEYVLLPVERAYEVIEEELKQEKYLTEVMHNITDYANYIEE